MYLTSLNKSPSQTVSHNREIKKKLLIPFGKIPHLTNFSQATFAPGQIAPSHAHSDMYELFFIESGTGEIKIDEIIYPLQPGDCVTVEPNERHELSNSGETELIITYLGITK